MSLDWLSAWWRALTGRHPAPTAVREQPEIRALRDHQHALIDQLQTEIVRRERMVFERRVQREREARGEVDGC